MTQYKNFATSQLRNFATSQLRNFATSQLRNFALILCLVTSNLLSQAQAPYQRDFTPKSPEASAFNKYGDIGVSQFTGSPNIAFPLSLSEEVPISISYNASGIKPEEHHGWVGTNWNLNVGGIISRIKRGLSDEIKMPGFAFDRSYMNNNWRLKGSENSWDATALTHKTIYNKHSSNPDTVKQRTYVADLEPDEFIFNFNGHSGSFLLNHEGEWVFRGNNPSEYRMKKVELNFGTTNSIAVNLTNDVVIDHPRAITSFIIESSDGTEYCFGGDYSAIDFTHTIDPTLQGINFYNLAHYLTTPTGWHLTKIRHASGKEINFIYQKDEFNVVGNKTRNLGSTTTRVNNVDGSTSNSSIAATYSILINSYLYEVQTPYNTIKFIREALTGIADYPLEPGGFRDYIFGGINIDLNKRKWFKLAKIQTFNKPEANNTPKLLTEFQFVYAASPSNRLQLTDIKQIDVEDTNTPPNSITQYAFEYNNLNALPAYLTGKIDHWGYFNNNGMLNNGILSNTTEESYKSFRNPNIDVMGYEMLNKIKYPTGGYTSFVFEPHDYQDYFENILPKDVNNNIQYNAPFKSKSESSKKSAGGLRIKTIIHSDGTNEIEKQYLYVKNYKNITEKTSGILSQKPTYFDIYQGSFSTLEVISHSFMNEQSLNPLNLTNGSPVTYSEVVEKNKDGSYTIYQYSNFDNTSYCNRSPKAISTRFGTKALNPEKDPVIDYEHLRGRLLSEKHYNSVDKIVKEVNNEYTSILFDSQAIRVVTSAEAIFFASGGYEPERRAVSYYIHTSPVFLTKSSTTDYFYEGTNTSQIAVVTTNEYDSRKNIIQQKVTNLNNAEPKSNVTTDYSYAYDKNVTTSLVVNPNVSESTNAQGHRQAMINKFMIGIPLETKNNFNKGSKVEYKNLSNGMPTPSLLPYKFYSQNRLTPTQFDEQFRIEIYTDYDRPSITYQKGFTTPVAYSWSNGLLSQKSFGVSPSNLTWYFTYDQTKRRLDSKIDENGLRAKFAYDGYRRLTTVVDRFDGTVASPINPQATTTYNYHYTGQPVPLANDINDLNQNFISTNTTFINATNTTPLSTKQYLDGLGRPVEVVKEFYTPTAPTHPSNFWHQKNYVGYDALGRQNKAYLPFESGTLGFEAASTSASVHPFILTEYEASPLSRPIKQTNVDGTTVQTSYGTNTGDEVRNILNLATYNGYRYDANTLSKYTMTDENGKQTCVFKDKLGRVILTRKFLGTQAVDTYNIYDNYGQLVAVLPPGSVDASSGIVTASLIFQYTYDNLNRLIEKKVPGAEPQKFFYNDKDQLVLTQDANMRTPQFTGDDGAPNKYLATFYDEIGRIKKTGFAFVSPTVGQDFNLLETNISIVLTETQYYPNKSWVKNQGARVIAPVGVTTNRNFVWSYIERRDGITYTGNPVWTGKQHLLLANQPERPILDDDAYGVDWSVSGYDGLQKPTLTLHYLFTGTAHPEVRTYETYMYDNGQRLTNLNHIFTLNGVGLTTPTFTLSNMVYNYKDQLNRKNIANINNKFLQSTDYTYNLRGWLTSIGDGNSPSPTNDYPNFKCTDYSPFSSGQYNDYVTLPYPNSAIGQGNASLFSEKIRYEAPNVYPNNGSGVTPQYNGNISQVEWQVAGREPQAYSFKYDDLDRLTEANYTDIHTGAWSSKGWASQFESDNKFQEKVSYDIRGNIQSLERNGLFANSSYSTSNRFFLCGYFGKMDNLTYGYGDSNRLKKVTDASESGKGFIYANTGNPRDYEYDKNGNLTADRNKGITNIQYNYLNLPQLITFTGNRTIGFVYDASGSKLQKITNDNGTIVTQNYINGIEYIGNTLERIPHTEGEIVNRGGTYVYEYALKDHLGNTRVTFTNNPGANTLYATDIKQINHYYPFGLNMEGPGFGAQGANKYQYNGKELNSDFGLNWNDYGARLYDAAVARWHVIDPMSDLASSLTPYRYGFNNPISFSDPDGMFESEDEAKQYAKDNGIKTGWFRSSKIVEQKDGSYAIENRKASTSISNDKQFGVTTAALHIERGVHLADVGFSGALALAESNPDGVFKNDGFDRLYYFGSYLQFAMPTAKLATASRVVTVTEEIKDVVVQFGKAENQIYHTFRHTDKLGLDRSTVKSIIESHFKTVAAQVVEGKPFNQTINVQGRNLQYTVFKLSDGSFNIGRIHEIL